MSLPSPTDYEVIIVGGSYAGLSAAVALGCSRRSALVLDAGQPRNRFMPHHGTLRISAEQETTVPGVYAAGDCCPAAPQLAQAIGAGTMAGAMLSRRLILQPRRPVAARNP